MYLLKWGIVCLGCGLLWTNRVKYAVLANAYYVKLNDWYIHNPYTVNKFSNKSSEILTNKSSDKLLLYTYTFRNNPYIILSDPITFKGVPYTVPYIDTQQSNTAISMLTNTPNDIISSELVLRDSTEIDYIDCIKMLAGPLGNFYKDTECELTSANLSIYLKIIFNEYDIVKVQYMLCNGEEYDLLNPRD
tara:strand:+ start:356 stop:925 length:570 start_codon:yes stop_codon:yes gene_type:complete